jgi:hypothetical protein
MQQDCTRQKRRLRFRNEISDDGVAQESTSRDSAPVDDEVIAQGPSKCGGTFANVYSDDGEILSLDTVLC